MHYLLISIVIALFIALLFLNIYFRVKVMKTYKILVQNRVEFRAKHIFNKQKMEKEIYPQYPEHRQDIETFVGHIQFSIKFALLLLVLISIFGFFLNYYR